MRKNKSWTVSSRARDRSAQYGDRSAMCPIDRVRCGDRSAAARLGRSSCARSIGRNTATDRQALGLFSNSCSSMADRSAGTLRPIG